MTTPRGAMTHLLNSYPWITPQSLSASVQFHAALRLMLRSANRLHQDDRIARLVVLRLETFLAHWPDPPTGSTVERFAVDAGVLAEHDVPRLRQTLAWASPVQPYQRAPRLGVVSLDTA